MEEMHPTTARLFEAVEEKNPGEAITSVVARRMGVSDNNVTNWKTRGISFKGSVLAEAALGVPAAWVMLGEKPPIENTWPFSEWVDYSRVRALSREDLIFIAGKLDDAVKDREAKSAQQRAAPAGLDIKKED